MAAPPPLIAGNWKMFGRRADLGEITALAGLAGPALMQVEALLCPPAPYVAAAAALAAGGPIAIGAQDCSPATEDSARTGDVSAAMLADCGARYVIVGHSERRALFAETDDLVRQKAEAAQGAGLAPIVCVGETRAERDAGRAASVVAAQVRASTPARADGLVIAYEPVWAIGAARTPEPGEIAEIHAVVRAELAGVYGAESTGVRVLYGGSVGPKNAAEIFGVAGVDGALVGRACLKAADFAAIVKAHPRAN